MTTPLALPAGGATTVVVGVMVVDGGGDVGVVGIAGGVVVGPAPGIH